MVRGNHEQVVVTQAGHDARKLAVKVAEGTGIAGRVIAVPVDHVKIHEVCVAEPREVAPGRLHRSLDALLVARGEDMVGDAAVRKDVIDLANGEHVLSGLLEHVEHRGSGGLKREVVSAGRALEVRPLPRVRARDDAGNAMLAREDLPRDAAVLVELLGRHHVLVGRNLEDAVGRGVDNELAGLELLATVVLNDLRAGIGLVAEHPTARLARELVQHLLGEAVGVRWEALGRDDARHLPVPHRGVLPG